MDASWELRSPNASPRSLCVFTASSDTNPFEVAAGETLTAPAVVFGTEKGSLHYRTYPSLSESSSGSSSNSNNASIPRAPLGVSSRMAASTTVPRAYLPVDLAGSSLPGAVVSLVQAPSPMRPVFLVLVDDHRGNSSSNNPGQGHYLALLVTLQQGSFSKLSTPQLPRVSAATYHPRTGFLLAGGRRLYNIPPEAFLETSKRRRTPLMDYSNVVLPASARGDADALQLTADGRVALVAVGNAVYAVAGQETSVSAPEGASGSTAPEALSLIKFAQSSQVHPVIVIDIQDQSMDPDWSSLLCANGRDCAVIDLHSYAPGQVSCTQPRNGVVTIGSPILSAATSWPWLALLTSDGLVSIRSPSCLAIPLKTVEVGTRPNDFFVLRTCWQESKHRVPWIVAASYSGEAKVLHCQPDTAQDLADRLMRHSIDAFGANGFPRSELAEAMHATFTATSYVGPEPTPQTRDLLRQYLEAILGLVDFEGGAAPGWPTEVSGGAHGNQSMGQSKTAAFSMTSQAGSGVASSSDMVKADSSPIVTAATPDALVTGSALLCLVCTIISSTKASTANRAAKACAAKMGVLVETSSTLTPAAVQLCEQVADRLLRESSQLISLLAGGTTGSNSRKKTSSLPMDLVEAATWLLRSCGKHERAIDVLYERIQQQRPSANTNLSSSSSITGFWSSIKYESYTATHLSELWGTGLDEACELVLDSPATTRLLENNPRLGLNVFTVLHPQNTSQWEQQRAKEDPLAHPVYPARVVQLLKSIQPSVHEVTVEAESLPMDTGHALAVAYLESAVGISTGRPTEEGAFDLVAPDEDQEERITDFHDELCYLLLEGVIAERGDDPQQSSQDTTELGKTYRQKLRNLLQWPLAKVRSDRLLNSLPKSFLQEKALVLGRLGKHEEALRILYVDCKSLDLALEYCDLRYERQRVVLERERARMAAAGITEERDDWNPFAPSKSVESSCTYLPLVKVALESDSDRRRGTTAAIQVLALRRAEIDRAAALRLLPKNVPVAAVARPFLIPALVESESLGRRLKVVSSLLRARHVALKQQLTDAQLMAQASLHVVPQLRALNLGDPLHSSKAFKARPSPSASATFPDVVIVKHFFPRHVVIQAKVTNSSAAVDGRSLGNVAFVVAESSEEVIQQSTLVPIKVLPFKATGSSWCVLVAAPTRMEGPAILTCELRYTVLGAADATALGTPLTYSSGRTFVEELQDLEVVSSNFS
eukprot:Nitzschia sp. Nitz4//scaffold68_size99682//22254//25922//NITZ4_004556-RA/size99682-processed-gene-0.36-mRNA-1//-1//CDS//3329556569//5985//frame0